MQRGGGDLGERFVGGGEDRERARALERLDQTGIAEELGERLEGAGGDRRLHDVLVLSLGGSRGGKREDRGRGEQGKLAHL